MHRGRTQYIGTFHPDLTRYAEKVTLATRLTWVTPNRARVPRVGFEPTLNGF